MHSIYGSAGRQVKAWALYLPEQEPVNLCPQFLDLHGVVHK